MHPITLIGVGNRFRSDDGVGFAIANQIKKKVIPEAELIEASGEGAALLEVFGSRKTVLLFDAVLSGSAPGTVFRFEAHSQTIPKKLFNYSTHAFSVAESIEMARALNRLPERLLVYGVEGKSFNSGSDLSVEVAAAIPKVIQLVGRDIQ